MDDRVAVTPGSPQRIDLGAGDSIRLLVPEDALVVFETVDRNRERLRPWLGWVDRTLGPADTRAFIDLTISTQGREFAYGIYVGDSFVGAIGLHTDPEHRSAMIGYWIDEEHEGRGLVTKAARAPTEVAFRDLAMHRVWLTADPKTPGAVPSPSGSGSAWKGSVERTRTRTGGSATPRSTRCSETSGRPTVARALADPPEPARASPRPRTRGRHPPGVRSPAG